MNQYILSTERLGLRRWLESDTEPFSLMCNDAEVMKYFPKRLTSAETIGMINRINGHFTENNFGLFAVENKNTNEFIGFTGFSIPRFNNFFTPCVEIGWRFKKEVWNQGFATEAALACLQYGFEILKLSKIVSFTSTLNINSEKVMKKIGMQYLQDFDHPNIAQSNELCRHVLYEISKEDFYQKKSHLMESN